MPSGRLENEALERYLVGAWDSYIRERSEAGEDETTRKAIRWVFEPDSHYRAVLPKSGEKAWRLMTTLAIDELSGRWEIADRQLSLEVEGVRLPLVGTFVSKWLGPLFAVANAVAPRIVDYELRVVNRNLVRTKRLAGTDPEYLGEEWRRIGR